jgi:hypothetical protein
MRRGERERLQRRKEYLESKGRILPVPASRRASRHEAGHYIAALYLGQSVGENGVSLDSTGGGTTDVPFTNLIGLAGPFAELGSFVPDELLLKSSMFDWFIAIHDAKGYEETHQTLRTGAGTDESKEALMNKAMRIGESCFMLARDPLNKGAIEFLENYHDGEGKKLIGLIPFAKNLVTEYKTEIDHFSEFLYIRRKLSKEQCDNWAVDNFHQKQISTLFSY